MTHESSPLSSPKFIDEFNRCSAILTEPDLHTRILFNQFCMLFGIGDVAGKLFFWLMSHRGVDYSTDDIATELETTVDEINEALEDLCRKSMIEDLSVIIPMESCDVTDLSITHAQDLYCFLRLLTN